MSFVSLFEALGENESNLEFRFSDYVGDMIVFDPVIGLYKDVEWTTKNDVQLARYKGRLLCVEILHADRDGVSERFLDGLDKSACVELMQQILSDRDVHW